MKFVLSVLAILFFGVAAFGWRIFHPPTETLRYRLTMEVETPEGLRAGSSVVEVVLSVNGFGTPYSMGKRGEAAVIDLGARGLLFAVLVGANGNRGYWELLPEGVLAPALGVHPHVTRDDADRLGVFHRLLQRPRGEQVEIPFGNLPMLVRFRNINDPKTVELVDPNDLAKSFGPGMKFSRATIEIADAPVTTGKIRALLPWSKTISGYLGGDYRTLDRASARSVQLLSLADFIDGEN